MAFVFIHLIGRYETLDGSRSFHLWQRGEYEYELCEAGGGYRYRKESTCEAMQAEVEARGLRRVG